MSKSTDPKAVLARRIQAAANEIDQARERGTRAHHAGEFEAVARDLNQQFAILQELECLWVLMGFGTEAPSILEVHQVANA